MCRVICPHILKARDFGLSKETYLKVGGYTPETEDTEAVIDRDYYRQGWIFKDEEAFLHYPDKVCYVPELSDEGYTRQDFLDMVGGQKEFARECFYAVDWQHPETWIDDLRFSEIVSETEDTQAIVANRVSRISMNQVEVRSTQKSG